MSKFKVAVMTDAGASLMAAAFADGFQIEFVKLVTGNGEYTEEEKTAEVLKKRVDLKGLQQEVYFSSAVMAEEQTVRLKALITNENLSDGYRMTEVGIIARKKDDESSEVLYSIAIADEADYLPSKENPIEIVQEFYTKISNAETVYIKTEMNAPALAEDMMSVLYPEYDTPETIKELKSKEDIYTAFGKIAAAVKKLIRHLENKDEPHREAFDTIYQQSTGYTDQKIAGLINGAPETLDTLKEIADAMEENKTVVDALEEAIGNRASEEEFQTHVGNGTIHITAEERKQWSEEQSERTVTFSQASERENIKSGEKMGIVFGKISKFFTDLGTGAFASTANNDSTTAAGYVADARIVKKHGDEIDTINKGLTKAFVIIEGVSGTYTIQPGDEDAIVQTVRTIPDGYKPVAICSVSTGNPYVLSRYTSATTGIVRLRNINTTTAQTGAAHMEVLCVKNSYL